MSPCRIRRSTRRQALGLGAAAVRRRGAARARLRVSHAAGAALFELDLDAEPLAASAAVAGWRTTRVLRAPRRFDLVGLRWARGSRAEAQVRARRRGGALDGVGDAAPGRRPRARRRPRRRRHRPRLRRRRRRAPAAPARQPARPCAPASCARCRRRRSPAASASGCAAGRARRPGARPRGRPVRVITRSEWGGDTVPPRAARRLRRRSRSRSCTTRSPRTTTRPEDSAAIVLGIARYHRDSNGWNDIGYNFLVDKYGQVFEGRAGGIDAPVIGAQAQGYNSVSTGIACLGHVHRGRPVRAGHGGARAADRLEAHAARRARPGPGDRHLRRRREQPLPLRHAGHARSASPATATATRPPAPATCSTASSPTCARAPPATRARWRR